MLVKVMKSPKAFEGSGVPEKMYVDPQHFKNISKFQGPLEAKRYQYIGCLEEKIKIASRIYDRRHKKNSRLKALGRLEKIL